jgi:hypothetical protein
MEKHLEAKVDRNGDIVKSQANSAASSPAVAEDLNSRNLWDRAYNVLRKKDEELIESYENGLLELQDPHQQAPGISTERSDGSADREERLAKQVDLKLQAVEDARLKFTIGKKEVIVKEQVDKIACAILFAKDFIGSAVSMEPYVALAWAGISTLLPVSHWIKVTVATVQC